MISIRRVLHPCWMAVCAIAVTVSVAGFGPAPTASAVDASKGHAGFCKDNIGVTVVVDFQALGGTTIVRCFPSATPGTGLDALKGAGIQIAGVQRWGESFICRIENRPSATEVVPITGNAGYREKCIDTPPASGYWSYWHSGNNCSWNYSQWGVKNRNFTPGGFEGWSFSLNATSDTNPMPRIAPVRPGTEGQGCDDSTESEPTSTSIYEQAPGQSGSTKTSTSASTAQATVPAGRPPVTRPSATSAASSTHAGASASVEYTGGEDLPDVNDELTENNGFNAYAPWAAGAVLVALAGLIAWTSYRRKRR